MRTEHKAQSRDMEGKGMSESGYQGYANETRMVALWIDNDPGLYEQRRELLGQIRRSPGKSPVLSRDERVLYAFEDALKSWVRDEMMPDLGATLAADLLGAALDDVDWRELAQAWIEEDSE
jgi:hypothetical protein